MLRGASRQERLPEWSDSGTLLQGRPGRGWLHPDSQLAADCGVTYGVRYVGAMPVLVSMKSLDFEARSRVTRECISIVCEAAGLKNQGKRKRDKKLAKYLGDLPVMQFSGSNVNVTITTECICVLGMDNGEMIANHNLFNVSFASGGDIETMDFVSYVAKSDLTGRLCHVIECTGGLASDLIATIGQAFEVRYKSHLHRERSNSGATVPAPVVAADSNMLNMSPPIPPAASAAIAAASISSSVRAKQPHAPLPALPPPPPPIIKKFDAVKQQPTAELVPVGQLVDLGMDLSTEVPSLPPRISPHQKETLTESEWYHGSLSRADAEHLLLFDGDFLVRAAGGQVGQFVLSGRHKGRIKHLLLVDPDGLVRTKERVFDSISHLINFHFESQMPIVSQDSEMLLRRAIKKC